MKNRSRERKSVWRYISGLLAVILAVTLVPSGKLMAAAVDDNGNLEIHTEDNEGKAAGEQETENESGVTEKDLTLSSKNNKVPTYKAGESKKWEFSLTNNSKKDMKSVSVRAELQDKYKEWPFKTEYQEYKWKTKKLSSRQTVDFSFKFTQREDIPTQRYTLQFVISVDGEDVKTQRIYVNTTAKEESDDGDDGTGGDKNPEDGGSSDGGDISNGDPGYSDGGGGGGEDSSSVPRVIVTGFATNPKEVRAGKDFTLIVHLQNTSKTAKVQNMLFDITAPSEGEDEQTTAPAFLPSSGSSTVYLDGIAAGGTADISMELNAKADLLQKPYSVELSMKYEDGSGSQVESSSSLSIPVKQNVRFEFSQFEINPASIPAGNEANVMFSLYNLGRVKLYNVKATFEGENIATEEVFVGNIDSGATASIDAMLEGTKVSGGPAKVTMTLSYEDESGKVSDKKEELELEVTEEAAEDIGMLEEMGEEEETKFPLFPIAIGAIAVIAAIGAAITIIKRNRKRKMRNEEEALLDELDGPSEDEWE